jgi:hypothetical protein
MTAPIWKSSSSRRKLRFSSLLTGCLLVALAFCFPALAQTVKLSQHLSISNPSAISIDRLDNIYFSDNSHTIYQHNSLGERMNTFSPTISGSVSSIEARTGVKILLFYADQQRVVILDRFMRELTSVSLFEKLGNVLIKAATFSAEDQLWLFDESSFSIMKVDAQSFEPIVTTPLNQILDRKQLDVRYMREYQNNLYLVEKTGGVYVFDNMGNYKKKLPFTGLDFVGFRGNELYYLQGGELHFFDLYKLTDRVVNFPQDQQYRTALAGEKFYYLFSPKGIDLYEVQ